MRTHAGARASWGEERAVGPRRLPGFLNIPARAGGVVLFAHGSGSGRMSERNQYVAGVLREAGIGTLLFDLLTEGESEDRENVFDIPLLADRLLEAAEWARAQPEAEGLSLGYFGASTGAAAALVAAARRPELVSAIVSRGGRPDLAAGLLSDVRAPTLLLVGGADDVVLELNRQAYARLECKKELAVVPGATHLFPEPGTLEAVARAASQWFQTYLQDAPMAEDRGAPVLEEPFRGYFRNREEAGRRLAHALRGRRLVRPLVLGIPRGGVVVGASLARELGAELDVALSRKLRAPYQPELAVGAVGEDGRVYLTAEARSVPGLTEEYLAEERAHQIGEIHRRQRLFRPQRPAAAIDGRSVIVTDDGIATGATMIAALDVVRAHNPYELIVATPVGAPGRLAEIRRRCDDLVCLHAPEDFWAIGQFYEDFEQVEDEEALELLREFAPAAS